MAGEIATAFVRIRPNMAGFEAETKSGVREAFSGLAEAVGLAFGAAETFHFGKEVTEGAANLQHQIENIRIEFGRAGDALVEFGDKGATSLGISAAVADTASARFGLLFRNLGIGPGLASQMTLGLEKLGGSLAAIRGIDPATVFQNLPLALTGNTRVLKSLGLAIDSTQIKFAALKLGLISNVKQALTPAVKAEAVYALATANLGQIQSQAARHAGDLSNVQARLSAEWSNAKDALGKALLPQVTRLTTALANWLGRMERSGKLQADFNQAANVTARVVKAVTAAVSTGWQIWQTATGWIHGTKNAIVGLLAVLAVNKIRSIASAIANNLIKNGFVALGAASEEAKAKAVTSFGRIGVAARGLAITIRTALIELGFTALAIAAGLVAEYVITHWTLVKNYTVAVAKNMSAVWHGFAEEVVGEMNIVAGAINTALTAPIVGFTQLASKAFGWVPVVGKHIKGAADSVLKFSMKVGPSLIGTGMKQVKEGGQAISDALYLSAAEALAKSSGDSKTLTKLKSMGKNMGGAISDGIVTEVGNSTPTKVATVVGNGMKLAIEAAQQRIAASISAAKDNLDKIGGKLADSVNKILAKLGTNGPAGSAQKAAIKKLQNLIQQGAPGFAITRASQELSSDLQSAGKSNGQDKTAREAAVKQSVANLTDAFNQGHISIATFNKRLTDLLKKDKVSYKVAGKTLGSAFADGFKAEIAGLRAQAAALDAVPKRLRGTGGGGGSSDIKIIRPLEVIRRENQIIATKAERQRATQIKAAERAAKAAEKTAQNTAQLRSTKVGTLPGAKSEGARQNAKAGVKP